MKKLLLAALVIFIYVALSPSPAFAFDSFGFYCQPYTKTFEEGKHYIATSSATSRYETCWFEIPASVASGTQNVNIGVYKGTVGNAKLLFNAPLNPEYWANKTYVYENINFFYTYENDYTPISPRQDEDFFAVVHDGGYWDSVKGNVTLTQFQNFFTNGGTAPNNNYQIIRWKWGAKPVSEWDPVVIIPGILGSWEKNGTWILDPLAHTYDNLVETLKANGYVENQTLFTLPYDWEQSNVATAQLLKQKIEQIKTTCGCSKVDLVAHSMGGLVATQYIMSDTYSNDVDQLFMLGTPIAGAPKAYKTWESGEVDFGDVFINTFLGRIFAREATDNGYSNVFEYIRNKPVTSIQELLPVYQNYLKQGSTFLQYPTGYPQNPFLENLIGNPTNYYNKHKQVQTYVITGKLNGASTPTGFVVKTSTQLPKWEHGEIVSTINGIGDGTVPFDNAVYFSGPEKEFQNTEHKLLASSSSAYVFSQLTGSHLATTVGKIYTPLDADWSVVANKISPSANEFNVLLQAVKETFQDAALHTLLMIMIFSPVDVQITAPDGKKLGKDFVTGANINEIPNSVYSGPIDEHEYVLILDPLPGEYKVETVGTGGGAYTIAAGRMDSATTSTSLLSGTTTLNQITQNTLFLSSTSTTVVLTPPPPPVATSTPTTTPITPETCIKNITEAYQAKWIGKKVVYQKLVANCKALKGLLKAREHAYTKPGMYAINTAIRRTLANMDLLAKDRNNTKDAILLITKITTWFRTHELGQ